jgi:diaminopimelate epimerase
VEDETFSCGTGVTAAVLSYAISQNLENGEVFVSTKGGKLSVNFEHKKSGFVNIWLNGPAEFVFNGLY